MREEGRRIGIVGAGVMGRVLAWFLRRQGHQIHVFDQGQRIIQSTDQNTSASANAAGMLAPYSELESAESQVFDLGNQHTLMICYDDSTLKATGYNGLLLLLRHLSHASFHLLSIHP